MVNNFCIPVCNSIILEADGLKHIMYNLSILNRNTYEYYLTSMSVGTWKTYVQCDYSDVITDHFDEYLPPLLNKTNSILLYHWFYIVFTRIYESEGLPLRLGNKIIS